MSAETIARRYANAHPGQQLVSYREVALPLFKVDLDLLVLDRKALHPLDEFVLRAVDAGLTDTEQIAGVLGIEQPLIRQRTAELLFHDSLRLAGERDDPRHRLQLTRQGQQAVAEAVQVQTAEVTMPVWIDGLTWNVISTRPPGSQWFAAWKSQDRGLVEVAAYPRGRPGLENIPLQSVQTAARAESKGRRRQRDVLAITGLGRTERYAREAVALAFRDEEDPRPVIRLIIDGEPSQAHDTCLSNALASSARRVTTETWTALPAAGRKNVPPHLLKLAAQPESVRELEDEKTSLTSRASELRQASHDAAAQELADLREQLARTESQLETVSRAYDNISVRQVPVYEHRDYLERALQTAESRVLIISPWIAHDVVDDAFVGQLRKMLGRGVQLWIGYGITPNEEKRKGAHGERDKAAERKLKILQRDFPEFFHFKRLGDTHAKVLVCDSRYSILTSFNWLSFRGDDRLRFRDERGYYVGLSEHVDELFDDYAARFEGH